MAKKSNGKKKTKAITPKKEISEAIPKQIEKQHEQIAAPEIKEEPKKEEIPISTPLDLVSKQFHQKEGKKLKICPLWTSEEGRNFFRVNYIDYDTAECESYWVEVDKEGVLTVKTT